MTNANIIEIFCILDEFCKYFTPELKKHTLDTGDKRPPQQAMPHVRQRSYDHPRPLPYNATP